MIRCATCGRFCSEPWAGECYPCWERTSERMFWEQVPVMDAALRAMGEGAERE